MPTPCNKATARSSLRAVTAYCTATFLLLPPTSAYRLSTLCQIWPMSVEVAASLVRSGPTSTAFGKFQSGFGPSSANPGPDSTNFERCRSELPPCGRTPACVPRTCTSLVPEPRLTGEANPALCDLLSLCATNPPRSQQHEQRTKAKAQANAQPTAPLRNARASPPSGARAAPGLRFVASSTASLSSPSSG